METITKTFANAPTLAERAHNIRRNALRMGEVQGQGYIAQALDISDVLAAAYFHAMRYRPEDPTWEGRDRFLLSNGHYAIALYAALIEAGIVPEAELETYGFDESRLPMSGMASYTPGMEMSGGSLGLLDNLIAIVDVNNQQADGPSTQVMAFEPLVDKLKAFGWFVRRVDGNDLDAVIAAFDAAKADPEPRPHMIVADTLMGKGVPFLEQREKNHFIRVEAHEWQLALAALEAGRQS